MSDDEEYSSSEEEEEEGKQEEKRRKDEVAKKKADVRKRLEETSAKKAKKGFMTPERKKKLRLLLRKKAAEELKKEQERKSEERRQMIAQRCGQKKSLDGLTEAGVAQLCQAHQQRIEQLESLRWDLELDVIAKDHEINELNISVNDLRGKFIKPSLKKVSKYENKFAKLQKKAAEFNFRNQLKTVKKKEFTMEDEDKDAGKPDWAPKHEEDLKEDEEDADSKPAAEGQGESASEMEAQLSNQMEPPSMTA